MKIAVLTCNTGGGHNSAANAIKEYFEKNGSTCEVINFLELGGKLESKAIADGHVFLYRWFPKLFGLGYRFEENHQPKFIYKQSARLAHPLYSRLKSLGVDTVIAVHVFPALALTEIRRKFDPKMQFCFVSTDYTCSPGVADADMDKFFVPFGCKEEFISRGIDADKIYETGIPVAPQFYKKKPRDKAREELGIEKSGTFALLMCGSMGCGPLKKLATDISEKMPSDATLAVICGSNKQLFDELSAENLRRVKVVGFTDKMSDYMDAADLLISKPGGLSSTESFIKRLPLVCMDAVPGCETRNIEFFQKHSYVKVAKDADFLSTLAVELMVRPDILIEMKDRLEREFDYIAAENIYKYTT